MNEAIDVFLSYNWGICSQIKQLETNLTQLGLKVFREQKEESLDYPLTSQLADAIKDSNLIVSCLTLPYCKSHNCNLQIEYANSLGKSIVVLMMEDLNFEEINNITVTGRKNTKTRIGSMLNFCYRINYSSDSENWTTEVSNEIKSFIGGDSKPEEPKVEPAFKNLSLPKEFQPSDTSFQINSKDDKKTKKKVIYRNKYERLDFLSAGSFGEVFTVLNLEDEKIYALKITRLDDESANENTLNEAKLLRGLSSPFIIKYFDCFFESLRIFLITEYCQDGDLGAKIRQKKDSNQVFDEENIFLWAQEMIFGIFFLHSHSIIHRDIKPGNIFLQNGHVKLGDLGCAKYILFSIANSLKGTIKYMSPEMISGKPYDCKTDIWSTGVIIYELITLEYPFKGNSLYELIQSILIDKIPNLETSRILKNLIKMMLQRELDVRADSKQLKYFLED